MRSVWQSSITCMITLCLARSSAWGWDPEVNLTPEYVGAGAPNIAVDSLGRVHAVYAAQPSGQSLRFFYRVRIGSTWSAPQDLPGPNHKEPEAAMAMDASGHLHVVGIYRVDGTANTPYTVYYWEYDGSTWAGPTMLSSGQGNDANNCGSVNIVVDRNQDLHVIWSQDGMTGGEGDIMYRKRQGGIWQAIQNVTRNNPGTSYGSSSPDIAVARNGNTVHVVWHDDFLNNGFQVYYTRNTNLGDPAAWLPSGQWRQMSTGDYGKAPRVIVDRNDDPNVWWIDRFGGSTNVLAYSRQTAGVWTAAANWGAIGHQGAAFDANNVMHFLYTDAPGGTTELYYRRYNYSTGFTPPELVSAGSNTLKVDYAALALDSAGAPYALWEERKGEWPGTAYIFYSTTAAPAPTGTLTGVVRDQYGAGVSGATVSVTSGQSTSTGPGGTYALACMVGTWNVSAAKPYYTGQTAYGVVINNAQATNVDFTITAQTPGPVTTFTATPATNANQLRWQNPGSGAFTGTVIRVRTDAYPTSPTDGSHVTDAQGAPGSTATFNHVALAPGVRYYYTAFTYFQDASRHYGSTGVNTSAVPLLGGDYDNDGDVDLNDFALFQMCFAGPNTPPAYGGCDKPDMDADGDVDLIDFGLFQSCFNGPNNPPACR